MPAPSNAADTPVAIVTGAGSGVGLETTRLLASKGWSVALAARTREKLEAARAALQGEGCDAGRVLVHDCDVADPDRVAGLVRATHERFGRIDALVNNAGLAALRPIDKSDPAFLQEMFAVNALGPAYAISACWPIFREQKRGCVVNVATKGTADPFPGFFAYAGAKASVNTFVKSVANEGKRFNIRGFSVAPGAIDTPMLRSMWDEKVLPSDKCLKAADVAAVIVACIEGERDDENGETIYLLPPGA